jgi:hypothetical protein
MGIQATNSDCSGRYGNTDTSLYFTCPLPGPSLDGTYSCTADPDPGQAQAQLSWTAVTGANRYELRFCTGTTCNPAAGTVLYTGANRTFNHNDRLSGTTYRYVVRAGVSTFNHWGAWSNIRNIAPVCPVATPVPGAVSCSALPNPSSGHAPLNGVDLRVSAFGGTGSPPYTYYVDCNNDGTPDRIMFNQAVSVYNFVDACNYTTAGTYSIRGRVAQGSNISTWCPATVTVLTGVSPTPSRTPTPTLTLTPTITLSPTPGPAHSVSGSIYLRNNATETSCSEVSGVDTKVNQLDGHLSVSAGGQTVNVGHTGITGDFFISGIPEISSSLPVELLNVDTTKYEWVRPAGDTQGVPNICTTPSSPTIFNQDVSNVNWFIRELRYPWWQVVGGDVGAMGLGGVVVESKIPGGYPGSKYIIAQGGGMDQGVVVQGSSIEPESGGGGITQISDWWVNSTYAEPRETYDVLHGYVYNGPGFTGSVDCATAICSALNQVPVAANTQYISVNGDLVLSGVWGVGSGESQTYVVVGNLTIPVNVQVGSGGFLAFIVSGKITINPGVTMVQGVYVADGLLETVSNGTNMDVPLEAQGMFVGWGGVDLNRDLVDDVVAPGERFTYRPDLIIRAPEAFRRDTYLWEELQP